MTDPQSKEQRLSGEACAFTPTAKAGDVKTEGTLPSPESGANVGIGSRRETARAVEGQPPDPSLFFGYNILKEFYRAKLIVDHARQFRSWPRWARIGHRLLCWRCPACKAFANGEHKGWGLEA